MKKLIATAFIFLFCLCGYAYAECPPGTQTVINSKTKEVLCFAMPNTPIDETSDWDDGNADTDEDRIAEGISAAGFTIDFGLGYAMIGSIDFRVMAGYQFATSADGLAFGLYTSLNGFLPKPYGLTWDVAPTLHVFSRSFRVSVGIGVGVFAEAEEVDDDYYYDEYGYYHYDDTEKTELNAYFMLKPMFRFDWFLTDSIMIGLNFDLPIYFEKEWKDDDVYSNGRFSTKKRKDIDSSVWYTMTVNIGYKF